jgi:hypothetical protein
VSAIPVVGAGRRNVPKLLYLEKIVHEDVVVVRRKRKLFVH